MNIYKAVKKSTQSFIVIVAVIVLAFFVAYLAITRFTAAGEKTLNRGIDKAADVANHGIDKAADIANHIMDTAADAFKTVFRSQVQINSDATVCDASPIAELAVAKRPVREIIEYSAADSFHSTKRIVAEQTFIAKIGFDLSARFSAAYDSSNRVLTISLPEPRILSLETYNPAPKYYVEESGVVNRLTTEDYQNVLIQLKDSARRSAESTLAIGDAKQVMETRFRDLFHAFGVGVVVKFSSQQPRLLETPPLPGQNANLK